MRDCRTVDAFVTPYVDGVIDASDRAAVDQHLGRCPLCRQRVVAEQAVQRLLRERQTALTASCAPAALRAACARAAATRIAVTTTMQTASRSWSRRLAPLAAAATLLLVVGGAFLYQATGRSTRLLAAELAADHLKCTVLNAMFGTHQTETSVEEEMVDHFGWTMHLPGGTGAQALELVGSRQCMYGHGRIAHIMYRRNGQLVSVYMLPRTERPAQTRDPLESTCRHASLSIL